MANQTRKARKAAKSTEAAKKARADERKTLAAKLQEWLDAGIAPTSATFVGMLQFYSERNAALIAMQRPGATEVRGYVAWREQGRQVRRGEHGIRILAPRGKRDAEAPTEDNPSGTDEMQFFGLISVFDITQTDPIDTDPRQVKDLSACGTEPTPEEVAVFARL